MNRYLLNLIGAGAGTFPGQYLRATWLTGRVKNAMKAVVCVFVLTAQPCFAQTTNAPASTAPVSASTWTTTDGKTYTNVKVIKFDASTVTIVDEDGGATIPLANLNPNLQKQFHDDPATTPTSKAPSAANAMAAADDKRARRLRAIEKLHNILDNPSVSDADKARTARLELDLLDSDTGVMAETEKQVAVLTKAYNTLIKVCNDGILPDGVKPDPHLYPYVQTTPGDSH